MAKGSRQPAGAEADPLIHFLYNYTGRAEIEPYFIMSWDRREESRDMGNIIDLLEKLGSDAGLHEAAPEELDRQLTAAGADSSVRSAVLSADGRRLGRLLGANDNACGYINPWS
jgi:hypothetical protein